ncbi:MAG: phosphatidate cytidylyltransferase [Clostridiales bacterium]|nr:phosphatidate cytidylyltransferase [Candidatus Cacconaster stercorequi]
MKQRVLVAVVGVPFLLFVLCWCPAWATAALLAALSVIGAHELCSAVMKKETAAWCWGLAGCMAIFVIGCVLAEGEGITWSSAFFRIFLAAFVIELFVLAVIRYGKEKAFTFVDICTVLFSGIAIPLALSCLLRLRMMPYGGGLVMIPLVAAFCSDTMALFAGMAFGKHKLAPLASPKKTVEGAMGGLLGGMVGMLIFRFVFLLLTKQPLSVIWCLVIGLLGAAMGQLGDLSFSIIKREYGIKDYGKLLPGHGGVLDRFDSVIFTAPVVWLMVSCIKLY